MAALHVVPPVQALEQRKMRRSKRTQQAEMGCKEIKLSYLIVMQYNEIQRLAIECGVMKYPDQDSNLEPTA